MIHNTPCVPPTGWWRWESSLAHSLLFNFTWAAAALQISHPTTVYACMGTCPFPPAAPHPHPLPAISGANLKLCYYDCCTRCVGGQFRTSTPSINPAMGPTSWLNRPVPLPDNLSSNEAKLRSCNYTWTSLLRVSPLAKNLSWWLFDSPSRLLPWSLGSSAQTSLLTKAVFFLSLHMRIIINTYRHPWDKAHFGFSQLVFLLSQSLLFTALAITFAGKINSALAITNVSPFCFLWFAEVGHYPARYMANK